MLAPRKRFGQHFLRDGGVISHIIAALAPKKTDHLIEIGPGQGALTIPVLEQVKQLEVIELDRDLIPLLQARNRHHDKLIIYNEDVLRFDFETLKKDERLLRLFGNLPYNISTPLIFHVIRYAQLISDMLFMLQKEVAERLAAPVDSEHYSRLSVMVQYHCQVDLLFDVPASAFHPPPKVTSSIVRLTPHHAYPYLAQHYPLFETIVRQAFGQRRKTLRNSLREMISNDIWEKVNLSSDLRPENLSVQDFVNLSNACRIPE